MSVLNIVLLVFQVAVAIILVALILVQHGRGASAGVAFGSAASETVFGSQGSGGFLVRATSILAFLFLANSLVLGYIATQRVAEPTSLLDGDSMMLQETVEQTEASVSPEILDGNAEIPAPAADSPQSDMLELPAATGALPADDMPVMPANSSAPDVPPVPGQ